MKSPIEKYYANFGHPQGLLGRLIVSRMNGKRHAALAEWALTDLHLNDDATVVDVGCGGGANVARLLDMFPKGKVFGVDLAPVAVEKARQFNERAIAQGRCKIVGGNAKLLPFFKDTYDLVTAFETVYYWPSFNECLAEVHRVLKPGGTVLIANETDGIDRKGLKWAKLIKSMYIYTIDELKQYLAEAGFTDIVARHDEERHFICITAVK